MIEWLKQHWFLFAALVAAGTAWGQSVNKISNLEQRLAQNEQIIQNAARLDERTIIMQQQMKEQQQILIEILATQRVWAERNRIVVPQAPVETSK